MSTARVKAPLRIRSCWDSPKMLKRESLSDLSPRSAPLLATSRELRPRLPGSSRPPGKAAGGRNRNKSGQRCHCEQLQSSWRLSEARLVSKAHTALSCGGSEMSRPGTGDEVPVLLWKERWVPGWRHAAPPLWPHSLMLGRGGPGNTVANPPCATVRWPARHCELC